MRELVGARSNLGLETIEEHVHHVALGLVLDVLKKDAQGWQLRQVPQMVAVRSGVVKRPHRH